MRIKVLIWGFSGTKWENHNKITQEDIFNSQTVWRGKEKTSCHREFDNLQNRTITIDKTHFFCGLMRFFYKGYCCVLKEGDFIKI